MESPRGSGISKEHIQFIRLSFVLFSFGLSQGLFRLAFLACSTTLWRTITGPYANLFLICLGSRREHILHMLELLNECIEHCPKSPRGVRKHTPEKSRNIVGHA